MVRAVAHIKYQADAWRVNERLGFPLSGAGEHAYYYIEKENLNSLDIARALARASGVAVYEVGYAGLKDKHAVTRQWFSVPTRTDDWPLESPVSDDVWSAGGRLSCLRTGRHSHKLRRGQHAANEFIIRIRLDDPVDQVPNLSDWFPNYFGPQRVSESNLKSAREWLMARAGQTSTDTHSQRRGKGRRGRARPAREGWHLSVLRSEIFNSVLSLRQELGNFAIPIEGDALDDGIPTGPLWGRGRSAAGALAETIEGQALAKHRTICDALEFTGVQQSRRRLAQRPMDFEQRYIERGETDEAEWEVSFTLPPGAYATTLLAHHYTVCDDSQRYA